MGGREEKLGGEFQSTASLQGKYYRKIGSGRDINRSTYFNMNLIRDKLLDGWTRKEKV